MELNLSGPTIGIFAVKIGDIVKCIRRDGYFDYVRIDEIIKGDRSNEYAIIGLWRKVKGGDAGGCGISFKDIESGKVKRLELIDKTAYKKFYDIKE
jgi:hypothetical protein